MALGSTDGAIQHITDALTATGFTVAGAPTPKQARGNRCNIDLKAQDYRPHSKSIDKVETRYSITVTRTGAQNAGLSVQRTLAKDVNTMFNALWTANDDTYHVMRRASVVYDIGAKDTEQIAEVMISMYHYEEAF